MSTEVLFSSGWLGPYVLSNRIVMAPMTRNRAVEGNVPGPLAAVYYAQRASGGLLITEASQVAPEGVGYPNTPGTYSEAQVEGWRRVTEAVHRNGGKIYLQLWHVGRISHPSFQPGGVLPVAPSAIAAAGELYTAEGMKPFPTPRALETDEIAGVVEQFRRGAKNALEAGFDGVEIHGANGYLIDQFLRDGTNKRTDRYGGSAANRIRFALEVTEAVVDVWGPDRVGFRISPSSTFNDMHDSDPAETFGLLARELDRLGIGYLHVVGAQEGDLRRGARPVPLSHFRARFTKALIANAGYTKESAEAVLKEGQADFVAFGQLFLANPDLPRRLRDNLALNTPDPASFYGGSEKGYTDYPAASGL